MFGPPSFHRFGGRAEGPVKGKKFLKREGDALEEGTLWWGTVTWVPAVESETAPFKPGFYRADRRSTSMEQHLPFAQVPHPHTTSSLVQGRTFHAPYLIGANVSNYAPVSRSVGHTQRN